jgi:hypothetical protein
MGRGRCPAPYPLSEAKWVNGFSLKSSDPYFLVRGLCNFPQPNPQPSPYPQPGSCWTVPCSKCIPKAPSSSHPITAKLRWKDMGNTKAGGLGLWAELLSGNRGLKVEKMRARDKRAVTD